MIKIFLFCTIIFFIACSSFSSEIILENKQIMSDYDLEVCNLLIKLYPKQKIFPPRKYDINNEDKLDQISLKYLLIKNMNEQNIISYDVYKKAPIGDGSFAIVREFLCVLEKEEDKFIIVNKFKNLVVKVQTFKNRSLKEQENEAEIGKEAMPWLKMKPLIYDEKSKIGYIIQKNVGKEKVYKFKDLRLEKWQVWEIIIKIISQILYMHEKGYIHGDINPGNIMLNEEFEPFLIDPGFAKRKDDSGDKEGYTPGYIHPEAYNDRKNSTAGDIWSLAHTIIYILCHSNMPYRSLQKTHNTKENIKNLKKIYKKLINAHKNVKSELEHNIIDHKIIDNEYFEKYFFKSSEIKENAPWHDLEENIKKSIDLLLRRMLSYNPKNRPSIREVFCTVFDICCLIRKKIKNELCLNLFMIDLSF